MSTEVVTRTTISEKAEAAFMEGDLSRLSAAERVELYHSICEGLGLNPKTQPFGYITLKGKLRLYALKACTDQLRRIHGVSIMTTSNETSDGVYTVHITATDATGRSDTDMGCVVVENLKGEDLANARMKALTKAKRRVTLSLCGLGYLDESELDTVPKAKIVKMEPVLVETRQPIGTFEIPQPEPGYNLLNKAQMAQIHALAKELGEKLPATWRTDMKTRFKVNSASELSWDQATEIINEMLDLKGSV